MSVGIYYGKGVLKIKKKVSLCPKFSDLKLVSIWVALKFGPQLSSHCPEPS